MVLARQGLSLLQSHSVAPLSISVLELRCTHDIFLYPVLLLVLCGAVQSVQIRSISPGQQWPGFSFALHLLRVQGFYFALQKYSHIQALTACFVPSIQLYSPRRKTAHRAFQWLFL
jgi:hypothetical protein|nr:MAG TPA: hypothetical protein [Bacteriophage sp.]